MIVSVPMLFGAYENDVVNQPLVPTFAEPTMTSPRDLLVDQSPAYKPINISGKRSLLYAQVPNPAGATTIGLACQLDTVYPMFADICDDIDPPGSGWVIDSVTAWFWNFGSWSSWALVPYLDVIVYNDDGTVRPQDSAFIKVRVPQSNYTATTIGTNQYQVDMELPTPITLPGGVKYWFEIRPCTDFTVNGQTGTMSEVGIGNGMDLYFRFPLLGVDPWVTATTQWGFVYEAGFALYGDTIAAPVAYWEILDPPLFPLPCAGHSEASTHDGYYYVFGISNTDTVLVYDIANNQWLDGTTNPYGAGKYGTANAVNGKFYRVGGTAAFPTPLQRIDILDPPNTWSAGATPPTGFLDQITGVYNDSLLYVFGSGQWSMTPTTDVYFYDTYLDSWTTCTSFPSPGRGAMAGGIIDSFAILAFGYTTGNNYSNDYVVGIIDETDPSNITWGAWVSTGLTGCRRVPSGADEFNKVLWVIGGQISGGQLDRTLSYDPLLDTWTDWAMPKPAPICNITPLPITTTATGDIGVFVGGGYTSGYVGDHEVFHTGLYVGIEEKPAEKTEDASVFGFAPDMPTLTKAYAAIKYTTTESRNVSLKIYNASGRLVRTLVDRPRERSGTKTVYWNGKDNGGKTVASGVYFFRLTAENKVATKKIVVIR